MVYTLVFPVDYNHFIRVHVRKLCTTTTTLLSCAPVEPGALSNLGVSFLFCWTTVVNFLDRMKRGGARRNSLEVALSPKQTMLYKLV